MYTKIIHRVADDSFVVETVPGVPRHIPNFGDWQDEWQEISEYAKAHPEVVVEESPYQPTPEEIAAAELAKAKAERAEAVAALTVEVDGMVFDGDEKAQERMARAVLMAESPEETTEWVLADSTVAIVTAAQLRRACRAAGKAMGALWVKPYEA